MQSTEHNFFNHVKTILIISFMVLISIFIGIIGEENSGISYLKFIPNIIGVFLGILLFIVIINFKIFINKNSLEISLLASILLATTFLSEGIEDTFRWIQIGPILINVSPIIIPILLYNYSKFEGISSFKSLLPVIIVFFILLFQPDASQSLALLFGLLPYFYGKIKEKTTMLVGVVSVILSMTTWLQPDTLMPVPHVENIFLLIYELRPFGEVLIISSILFMFAPIIYIGDFRDKLTFSVTFYYLGSLIATLFGHFPVQIIGAGASPVLGIFIALGLLYSGKSNLE